MASRLQNVLVTALALSFGTSCSDEEPTTPEAPDPGGLTIVDGNAQIGTAGEELDEPLVVRVTTEEGEPVEGASVTWSVTTGGGTVETAPVLTDAEGEAERGWILGEALGEQTVLATSMGRSAVFRATAQDSQVPAAVVIVDGDAQMGTIGAQLPNPLVVRVENRFGRPVAGVEVVWSVEAGGGVITPAATSTDSYGLAQVTWTLGHGAAQQGALADVAGIPTRFKATAGRQ